MADLRLLHDIDTGEPFYPYVHKNGVIDDDGENVIEKLSNEIDALKNNKELVPTRNIFVASFKAYSNLDNSNGKYDMNTDKYPNTVATEEYIEVKPNTDYVLSHGGEGVYNTIWFEYDSNKTFLGIITDLVNEGGSTAKTGETTRYIRFKLYAVDKTEEMASVTKWQLEKGTVKTEYIETHVPKPESDTSFEDKTLEAIKEQLNSVRSAIIERNRENKFINFAFCSDTHVENTDGDQSGLLDIKTINQLASENWLDFVSHGGDVFNSYLEGSESNSQGITLEVALERLNNALASFNLVKMPVYIARGNHDVNVKYKPNYPDDNTVDTSQKITQAQFKMLCQNNWAKDVSNSYKCSFYKDYDTEKIRVVLLDVYGDDTQSPNFSNDLLNWICNTALMLGGKKDYSVVIIAHTFEGQITTIMNSVIDAFKKGNLYENTSKGVTADYSIQGACDFIGVVCGHSHAEIATSDNGYWNIQTNTSYKKYSDIVADNIYANVYTIDTVNHILYKQKLGTQGKSCAFDWVNLTYTELKI
jgi:predicted phosphodiesterase